MNKNLILFMGSNKYQIDKEIKELIHKYHFDELSYVKYDCEEQQLDEVLNDCETMPFLNDQKLVIVNNPIFLSAEKNKLEHNTDRFYNYLCRPNPYTILVINAYNVKLDKKKKINKFILDSADVHNYDNITEYEATEIIENKMKDLHVKISHDAIHELITRCECEALKLYSELDKITFYLYDKNEVTIDDIKLLVSEPLENNIFNLTNNFIEQNFSKAIRIYHKLLIQNEEPIVFSAILAKNFHHLYVIKQYQKMSFSEHQLKSVLKIHPFQLKKLYMIAQRIKEDVIVKIIKNLSKYDKDVKSGRVDKYLGFEILLLNNSH